MNRFLATLTAISTMTVSLCGFGLNANAWYDQDGIYHNYYKQFSANYTASNFPSGTSWKSKDMGYIVRPGNSINHNAARLTAYYNRGIWTDSAYTTIEPLLYNTYADCLVNNNAGSTRWSETATAYYDDPLESGTLTNINKKSGAYYKGTIYWDY